MSRRHKRPPSKYTKPSARIMGDHFRQDGGRPDNLVPKAKYTEQEAKARAKAEGKYAYPCSTCPHWHIGGPVRRRRIAS